MVHQWSAHNFNEAEQRIEFDHPPVWPKIVRRPHNRGQKEKQLQYSGDDQCDIAKARKQYAKEHDKAEYEYQPHGESEHGQQRQRR